MELMRNQIQFCDRVLDRTTVYEESTDAIVPDSYPDIERIVFAAGSAVIKDESPQSDRVLVSGTVKSTVLYQPEGEGDLREISIPISFAHIEEAKGLTTDSDCFVCCRVISVDARAVNSRKLNVTAKLCFEGKAYVNKEAEVTEDVDGGELPLEIRYLKQAMSLVKTVSTHEFTVLEDLDTPYTDGVELVHTSCDLRLTDSRPMHNKVVLKGEARLHCLLLENGGLRTADHTVPFTQIIDCDGMEESYAAGIQATVHHLDSELHEGGTLSVGIGACVLICVTQELEVRTIQDMYQTTRPLEVQTRQVRIADTRACGELRAESSETIATGLRVGRVISSHAVCYNVAQEDASRLRLTMSLALLLQGEDGNPQSVTRMVTAAAILPHPLDSATVQNLTVTASATPAGDENVTVRILIGGDLYGRTDHTFHDVTQVEAGPPDTDACDPVTLVLRFVEEEEQLWELAKRYHTTVRAIRSANDIAPDAEAAHARMLLIPICEK